MFWIQIIYSLKDICFISLNLIIVEFFCFLMNTLKKLIFLKEASKMKKITIKCTDKRYSFYFLICFFKYALLQPFPINNCIVVKRYLFLRIWLCLTFKSVSLVINLQESRIIHLNWLQYELVWNFDEFNLWFYWFWFWRLI